MLQIATALCLGKKLDKFMSLTPKELEHLKEVLTDITLQSHQAIQKDSSNYWGELKTEIAMLKNGQGRLEETLNKTLAQATKTNGRVTVLEMWRANSKGWVAGISCGILIILSLTVYIFKTSVNVLEDKQNELYSSLNSLLKK